MTFEQSATVLLDPFALTVLDAEHSAGEERWFTLGTSREGTLLAVHTYTATSLDSARIHHLGARGHPS